MHRLFYTALQSADQGSKEKSGLEYIEYICFSFYSFDLEYSCFGAQDALLHAGNIFLEGTLTLFDGEQYWSHIQQLLTLKCCLDLIQ